MLDSCCAIAVMAKAPCAGTVKTRLSPPLSYEASAALSAAFIRDVTENIALAARDAAIQGFIAYAPVATEMLFDGMLAPGTKLVLADGTAVADPGVSGFGRCLLHAARALFARGYGSVCLLNSDSPTLPTALLVQAAQALARPGDRVVLGPAEDGGYYLLGMKSPHAHLFADVAWSTDRVAEQTHARGSALGLDIVELATWYDVDDSRSLLRLLHESRSAPAINGFAAYPAPATFDCMAELRLQEMLKPTEAD